MPVPVVLQAGLRPKAGRILGLSRGPCEVQLLDWGEVGKLGIQLEGLAQLPEQALEGGQVELQALSLQVAVVYLLLSELDQLCCC